MQLSIDYKKPIGNGIITTLNKDQAYNRSIKKGKEAAAAVFSVLSK
jgi:6,7-dimethyl-8-ribityllumazine synthase